MPRPRPIVLAAMLLATGCAPRPVASPARPATDVRPGATDAMPAIDSRSADPVVQRWSFGGYEGHVIESAHYVIHTTVESDRFRELLPYFFEEALRRYTTELGRLPMPQKPMETYLFADSRQWEAKTHQLLPSEAGRYRNIGRGGYTTRGIAVLFYLDRSDTYAIAAHEGWHQYTQNTFRDSIPIWLEEGIATYMEVVRLDRGGSQFEPTRNFERWYTLRRAARRDRLIPFADLIRTSPQDYLAGSRTDLLTYYAQVWGLARFLADPANGMRGALEQVLRDAAEGRLHERLRSAGRGVPVEHRLIATYFDQDVRAFERAYLEYVDKLVEGYRSAAAVRAETVEPAGAE